jgi:hypothetical protein
MFKEIRLEKEMLSIVLKQNMDTCVIEEVDVERYVDDSLEGDWICIVETFRVNDEVYYNNSKAFIQSFTGEDNLSLLLESEVVVGMIECCIKKRFRCLRRRC